MLGAWAILLPRAAGVATAVILEWVLVIAGVAGLVATSRARAAPGFGWSLLSELAAVVVGVMLLVHPVWGLATLTLVVAGFFVADGIFMIAMAASHRRELSRRWEWMMVNGVVDLVLGAVIFSGWPGSAVWALGLLIGIDLVFGGMALLAIGLEAKKEAAL